MGDNPAFALSYPPRALRGETQTQAGPSSWPDTRKRVCRRRLWDALVRLGGYYLPAQALRNQTDVADASEAVHMVERLAHVVFGAAAGVQSAMHLPCLATPPHLASWTI